MQCVDDCEAVPATEKDTRPVAVKLCSVADGDPVAGKVVVTNGVTEPVPPS